MIFKIKRTDPNAKILEYANPGDAGKHDGGNYGFFHFYLYLVVKQKTKRHATRKALSSLPGMTREGWGGVQV